jgi:spermidine/putrescine transport system ATP-binding protein
MTIAWRPPVATDGVVTASLQSVTKTFAGQMAVDDLDLDVNAGEFFSILGPSGCGKTTTLRMLGGFLVPDSGEIFLAGKNVTNVPPYRRDVNTVFQSYALFEHLNVAENVAFGLKRRRVPKSEIVRRVGEMLALVNLSDRARARPGELSGGQQQRVALARALVNMPALLLLDEPLGALDLKLRRQMQVELKTIQREMGITFVFVTHDQEEALTMSDRIAVMNRGRLEQVAPSAELYERPATAFAASFIGASNMLACRASGGSVRIDGLDLAVQPAGPRLWKDGDRLMMAIRPEKMLVALSPDHDGPEVGAEVIEAVFMGATTQLTLRAGDRIEFRAVEFHPPGVPAGQYQPGDPVRVGWNASDAQFFSEETERRPQDPPAADAPRPTTTNLEVGGSS